MPKLTYTNENGLAIELGSKPPFFLTVLSGFSDVENIINSQQSPYQDGATIVTTNLSARHLTIEGEFLEERAAGQKRPY